MTMLAIPKKAKFEYQGRTGIIEDVTSRYVVLDFDGLGVKMFEPHQLQSAYIDGEFKILQAKTEFVLCDITDPDTKQRSNFISAALEHMHESGHPSSKRVMAEALAIATNRYGMIDGKIPSTSSLKRWYKKWANNGYSIAYILGKAKARRRKQFDERNLELLEKVIEREYLQLHGGSAANAYRCYLREFEQHLPTWERENAENSTRTGEKITLKPLSHGTFYTHIQKLNAYEVDRARMGVKAANKKHRWVEGSIITQRPLERVEVDAVHLNIAVVSEDASGKRICLRPIVYVAMDVFTRLIVGHIVDFGEKNASENSNAVVKLIKDVCNPLKVGKYTNIPFPLGGMPERIISDSGPAFIASTPKAMLQSAGIGHEVTQKASPWKKPFVERFFSTLKSQCMHSIEGYAGVRTRGIELDRTLEQMAHLTRDEFQAILEDYILRIYHNNPHKGLDGLTPIEMWESVKDRCPPQMMGDFTEIAKFRGQHEQRKITMPKGVLLKGVYYNCRELQEIGHQLERQCLERSVRIMYDPLDISEITVINPLTNEMIVTPATSPNIHEGLTLFEFQERKKAIKAKLNGQSITTMQRVVNRSKSSAKPKQKSASAQDIETPLSETEIGKIMTGGIGKDADILSPKDKKRGTKLGTKSPNDHQTPKPSARC
ncbi:hypothetical protein CWE13_08850 [Aliidiomarina shirensis]|uniref:Integrase catalytic domain-containing protein n=1 Tax=Aliidiomarina shirensis TaxID=1048642 RepID=A0A432WT45_9GAMM|nr:Mu transposase C-terminal domain-containing protein [Aliidiomarina shirensis]RUO36943.1 hypothetical protein CWE13_08850 [Aliidiomarina shirensis]